MTGNLENSVAATGLEKASFHSKAKPKNLQTTVQLHPFHMPARLCLKSFKWGFNGTWTNKFQIYKLGLEKAEEPETKLPAFIGLWERKVIKNYIYIYMCFTEYVKAFDCVDHNILWKSLKEMGIPDHLTSLLGNLYTGPEATVRTRKWNNGLVQN